MEVLEVFLPIFDILHTAHKHFMKIAFFILILSGCCASQVMCSYGIPLGDPYPEAYHIFSSSISNQGYDDLHHIRVPLTEEVEPAAHEIQVELMSLDDYAHAWLQNYQKYRSIRPYLAEDNHFDEGEREFLATSDGSTEHDYGSWDSENTTPISSEQGRYNKRQINDQNSYRILVNGSVGFNYKSLAAFAGTIALAMTVFF